jgi:3-methyladenine DNA glycosylase Tag
VLPDKPPTDAGYLEAAARIIFMGGLNRRVVDSKWPGFQAAFGGFEVSSVALMSPEDVDRLAQDDRVIKYHAKLQAVVDNARRMTELAGRHGSFSDYVDAIVSESGVDAASAALAKDFAYISPEGARNWLYSTGYDVGPVTDKVKLKYAPFTAESAD